jgi:hypothetical protein
MKKFHILTVSLLACLGGISAIAEGRGAAINANVNGVNSSSASIMPALAKAKSRAPSFTSFSLRPRTTFTGVLGDYTQGKAQVLLPLKGDSTYALYAIGEGSKTFSDDKNWMLGAGIGYRKIVDDKIYGVYVTANYNRSPFAKSYWIANIGAEILGKYWDFNINAYLPTAGRKTWRGEGWAEDYGIYQYGRFADDANRVQNYYDHWLYADFRENAGRGFDFRVGRVIPKFDKMKFYLGGYYFNTTDCGSIKGVSAKLTYELSKYTTVELTNTYDNYNHNRATLGVRFALGGYSEKEKKAFGLATRLLDPIDRGYGNTLVPFVTQTSYTDGGERLRYPNVFTVTPGSGGGPVSDKSSRRGIQGSGKVYDPYVGLTPENYADMISKSNSSGQRPIMFISSGEYNLFTSGWGEGNFALDAGVNIYGRTTDYKPAYGNDRPLLVGTMSVGEILKVNKGAFEIMPQPESDLVGGSRRGGGGYGGNYDGNNKYPTTKARVLIPAGDSTIDSIRLKYANTGLEPSAVLQIGGASNVWLSNSVIGGNDTADAANAVTAMVVDGGSTVNLVNAELYSAYTLTCTANCTKNAVVVNHGSTLNFVGGSNVVNINASSNITTSGVDAYVQGIYANNGSVINFSSGQNNILASHRSINTNFGGFRARGMHIFDSVANFINGANQISSVVQVNTSAGSSDLAAISYGIDSNNGVVNIYGGDNRVVTESSLSAGQAQDLWAYGIYNEQGGKVNFFGGVNSINAFGTNSASGVAVIASGIENLDSTSEINFTGGKTKVTVGIAGVGNNNNVYGIHTDSSASIKINDQAVSSPANLLNYIEFTRLAGDYSGGSQMLWDGQWDYNW